MTSKRVLVAGGGMGGVSAALSALQAGAHVTLVEKAGRLGGSAALSSGNLTTYADLEVFRASAPQGDEALQAAVHGTLPDAAQWVRSLGVELQPLHRAFGRYEGWTFSPAQFFTRATAAIQELGGRLRLSTALDSLVVDEGSVRGAVLVDDSGRSSVHPAGAVVLATGGFQGSPELLARYALLDADWLAHRSNPWSTGDGLSAAVGVGAGTSAGLGGLYGHALPAPPARLTAETFAEQSQYYGSRSVALDMTGRRFTDETAGAFEENVNAALARRPGGLGFYVFDDELGRLPIAPELPVTADVIASRAAAGGGVVVRAETLGELATGIGRYGVPSSVALRSLQDFADAMAAGTHERLDVPRVGGGMRLAHGPFTAVHVQAAITFTTGGIAVDEDMQVLRRSRSTAPTSSRWITDPRDLRRDAIPGLFAVGADIGGVSSVGYAGGLATALTTGRIAGAAAGQSWTEHTSTRRRS